MIQLTSCFEIDQNKCGKCPKKSVTQLLSSLGNEFSLQNAMALHKSQYQSLVMIQSFRVDKCLRIHAVNNTSLSNDSEWSRHIDEIYKPCLKKVAVLKKFKYVLNTKKILHIIVQCTFIHRGL